MPDAPGVSYENINIGGQTVRLFHCERHAMQLTDEGCASRFREALTHGKHDVSQFSKCSDCPIGAAHSGLAVKAKAESDCLRCGAWSRRLVHGRLCPSCFNREREVLKGRDRRGHKPNVHVRFWRSDEPRQQGRIDAIFNLTIVVNGKPEQYRAATLVEGLMQAVRAHPGEIPLNLAVPDAARMIAQPDLKRWTTT